MQRDTVTVNPNSYVIIHFKADNSGVWLFHCHIEWHVVMGLIATIIESPDDLAGGVIPEDHQAICRSQKYSTRGQCCRQYAELFGFEWGVGEAADSG
jgi:iron transport multicopper oxidase